MKKKINFNELKTFFLDIIICIIFGVVFVLLSNFNVGCIVASMFYISILVLREIKKNRILLEILLED